MEEEQVIYVVVDENTNQAQQVQFINGQPHLVVQDETGQSTVLDGQQLVVEDENGEQMVIGGGATSAAGQGQPMIVMQEDGTPIITDGEGNIVQQDLVSTGADTGNSGKFILGADGSISLDQLGDIQSITPITSNVVSEPPAPVITQTKAHPKFVVTSSGLQIQGSQSQAAGTNGSPAVTSTPATQPQVSLLRQAFNNASPEKTQFVSVTPQPQPAPVKVQVPTATITIPAAKPVEKPVICTSVSNGHSVPAATTLAQTVSISASTLSVPEPGPGPGPEIMETDDVPEPPEVEPVPEVVAPEPEPDQAPVEEPIIPEATPLESNSNQEELPEEPKPVEEPMEAESMDVTPTEEAKLPEPVAPVEESKTKEPEPEDPASAEPVVSKSAEPENVPSRVVIASDFAPANLIPNEPVQEQESGASLIINVKKLGEEAETAEPKTTTVVDAAQVEETTQKGGLNDSTSSFKTYVGNSEDDDDPADYYQNVDPIESYLTARDEENGIPPESLEASPQKEPIDYESVFPSPQKKTPAEEKTEDSTAPTEEAPRRRGRPPKKLGGASPRVSSASDSETSAPITYSKRSQRQARSIYRRPADGSPNTSTSAKEVSDNNDNADGIAEGEPMSATEEQSEKETDVTDVKEDETVKADEVVDTEAGEQESSAETPAEIPKKRGRGRPRKSEIIVMKDTSEEVEEPESSQPEAEDETSVVETPTPRRRGRPPKNRTPVSPAVATASEADDSQTEEAPFKRTPAVRGKGRGRPRSQPAEEKEESNAETSQDEELEEGEIDLRQIGNKKAQEKFEPQPGTSREMSRTGRRKSSINYKEMAGSTDADTASDAEDSEREEEEEEPKTPARRGRPRKVVEPPAKSPLKTYEMRKTKMSPVKSTGKTFIGKSPRSGPIKIGETFSPKLGKDGKGWRGEISSLRKEIEGLRSTNDQLQTKLEMTDQQVMSSDTKELNSRIEKLVALNSDLKNKLKEAESRAASSASAPKFSLNLGLFKGPKFEKFVRKSGSSHNSSSSGLNSDSGSGLAKQKDQLGAMNKDLKNKEAMLEKREHKARALDQELDDRTSQLKVKEAKLNRWEQKLKAHEKELDYRERNLGRSEKASGETTGRKSSDTEKKLRELLDRKDRADELEKKLKEKEKEVRAQNTALKALQKQIDAKEKELDKREADIERKEKGLQGKDQILATLETQLTALGSELSEKYEYLQSLEQNVNSDEESTMPKSPVKFKGAAAEFEKEKDALLQKLTDITDKSKSDRKKSMAEKSQEGATGKGRGRPRKSVGSPAVGQSRQKDTPNRPVTKASLASPDTTPRGRGRPKKDATKTPGSEQNASEKQGPIRKLNKSEPSSLRLNRKRKASAEPVKVTKMRKKSL